MSRPMRQAGVLPAPLSLGKVLFLSSAFFKVPGSPLPPSPSVPPLKALSETREVQKWDKRFPKLYKHQITVYFTHMVNHGEIRMWLTYKQLMKLHLKAKGWRKTKWLRWVLFSLPERKKSKGGLGSDLEYLTRVLKIQATWLVVEVGCDKASQSGCSGRKWGPLVLSRALEPHRPTQDSQCCPHLLYDLGLVKLAGWASVSLCKMEFI